MDALAAMIAALPGRMGIRRPAMPEGMLLVPVAEGGRCHAIMVKPAACDDWQPTLEDVLAEDWLVTDWRKACG